MTTKEDIFQIIEDMNINVDVLSLDTSRSLYQQGLDSLDMATILFELEERYPVKFKEVDIGNGKLASIDKILGYMNGWDTESGGGDLRDRPHRVRADGGAIS